MSNHQLPPANHSQQWGYLFTQSEQIEHQKTEQTQDHGHEHEQLETMRPPLSPAELFAYQVSPQSLPCAMYVSDRANPHHSIDRRSMTMQKSLPTLSTTAPPRPPTGLLSNIKASPLPWPSRPPRPLGRHTTGFRCTTKVARSPL